MLTATVITTCGRTSLFENIGIGYFETVADIDPAGTRPHCGTELMTTDMKGAPKRSTETVVGWKTEAVRNGAGQPVTPCSNRGSDTSSVGGVMTKPAEVKAAAVLGHVYRSATKLEEAVAQIKKLGGRTHTEVITIPDVGPHAVDAGPAGRGVLHHRTVKQRAAPENAPEVAKRRGTS
jgi:predicted enzyme related to lactoylglutathione lyase